MRQLIFLLLLLPVQVTFSQDVTQDVHPDKTSNWSICVQYQYLDSQGEEDFINNPDRKSSSPSRSYPGHGFILSAQRDIANWAFSIGFSFKKVGRNYKVPRDIVTNGFLMTYPKYSKVYRYLGIPIQGSYAIRKNRHEFSPFIGIEYVVGIDKYFHYSDDYAFILQVATKETVDNDWVNQYYAFFGLQYAYWLSEKWAISMAFRSEWGLEPVVQHDIAQKAHLFSQGITLGVRRFI